jgi:predicted lipoprotein with Yx(FWY)xxD motif
VHARSTEEPFAVRTPLIIAVAVTLLTVAGCGSSSSNSSSGSGAPAGTPAPATAPGLIGTAKSSLGTFLVDGDGRTLYLWEGDSGTRSACSGGCAAEWPPVTTGATPKASGGVRASRLGTTKRSGGTLQVTYAGHPLYTFAGDSGKGQTSGEGNDSFGAPWWVVAPGGAAITH